MKHVTHNMEHLKNELIHKQDGVTLLLTVLILGGVTLITVLISAFAISELRSSRAVILSEPAITAAETGGEQGIWELKRSGSIQNSSVVLTNNAVVNKSMFLSSATLKLKQSVPLSFFLYDPNNINGNLSPGYYSLIVTNRSPSFSISVIAQTIDGQVFINGQNVGPNASVAIPAQQPSATNLVNLSPGNDERYKVTLQANGNATVDVTATDSSGVSQGLPDFPTVDSQGCSARSNILSCTSNSDSFIRRLNILVPK